MVNPFIEKTQSSKPCFTSQRLCGKVRRGELELGGWSAPKSCLLIGRRVPLNWHRASSSSPLFFPPWASFLRCPTWQEKSFHSAQGRIKEMIARLGVRMPGDSTPALLLSGCVVSDESLHISEVQSPVRITMLSYPAWWFVLRIQTMMWNFFSKYSPLLKMGVILNNSKLINLFLINPDVRLRE